MRWVTLLLQVRCGLMRQVESPLINPTVLPLLSAQAIATSKALAIAPHPDDETLGCGGAIALLRSLGCQVRVLVISDGTMSHPRSRKYPPAALRELREAETLAATGVLGVDASEVTFLRLPDGAIPMLEDAQVKDAVSVCRATIATFAPDTIFLPWRYDPHPDHRATWQLIQTALALEVEGRGQGDKGNKGDKGDNYPLPITHYQLPITNHQSKIQNPKSKIDSPRLIEYPIWDWDPEQRGNLSQSDRVTAWRLDITQVVQLKQQAIAAYRSQTTDLIDDDPEGFRLTPEMLANFTRPWEVYLEEIR